MPTPVEAGTARPEFDPAGVWVIIPTLHEVHTLPAVVAGVLPFCERVLIMDGGSTDGTLEWVHRQMEQEPRLVLEMQQASGKGAALREAMHACGGRYTVFIDADGSHDPRDIPRLVAPLRQNEADMVVGCRWTGGSDELHGDMNKWLRRAGSRLLTGLVNLRYGTDLTDIQNGFRALPTAVGRRVGLREDGFTIEQEMVLKFLAGGFRVINVPTHEYQRAGGEAKLNVRRVWFRFGAVMISHLLGWSRPRLRRRRAQTPWSRWRTGS